MMVRHMEAKPSSHAPTAPVAILASARSNTLARLADIDETTLRRFVADIERERRREQKIMAIGAAFPYIPFVFFPHPIIVVVGTAAAALTVGAAYAINRTMQRAFHDGADEYGLTPELSRELSKRVKRVAGYVPRWVRGQERIAEITKKLRAME